MTDKEILDKYINLQDSCLNEDERTQVIEMLYKYKDVFSFRDEIGMCPNCCVTQNLFKRIISISI